MNKKNIALIATLLCFNSSFALLENAGYAATQGSQPEQQSDSQERKAREIDLRRLAALEEEESIAHFRTNIADAGLFFGLFFTGLGMKSNDKDIAAAGITLTIFSGLGGIMYKEQESCRAKERRIERAIIHKRLHSHLHNH